LSIHDWFIQFEPESLWGIPWWEIETDINQDEAYFNGLVPVGWTVFDELSEDEAHPDDLSDYDNDSNSDELDWDMLFYGD
jgi:hypothetical protein